VCFFLAAVLARRSLDYEAASPAPSV